MRLALLASLAGQVGCGYALVGRGANVDPSIKRMGVPLFKDGTGKAGLDEKITRKVIEELLKRGGFEVVQETTGVDALVEGELVAYNVVPVGFGEETEGQRGAQPNRYIITLTARIRYTKTGAKEPIWSNDSFAVREEYNVQSAEGFFDREDLGVERMAIAFSRSLVAAMLEAF